MKRVAILIDGEYFARALKKALRFHGRPNAKLTHFNALKLAAENEEVIRIFYYDSHPSTERSRHPVTNESIDFAASLAAKRRPLFLARLGQLDLVALRCGETRHRGWSLNRKYLERLRAGNIAPPKEEDYQPLFEQICESESTSQHFR